MKTTSLIFLLVCAVPLFAGLFYVLQKDKPKRRWSVFLLAFLFLFALFAIAMLTKDLAPVE